MVDSPLASLSPAKRAKLERKTQGITDRRFGDPDLAEQFYVNSRTGPVITRGPDFPMADRTLSPDMYQAGLEQMRQMQRISSATGAITPSLMQQGAGTDDAFSATPGNALGVWSNVGPSNQGGRTRSILIDPVNPNIMYSGGVAGGVWKSTDAGATWSTNTDQMANLAVVTLAFDPSNSNTIYAGTGEGVGNADAIRGAGIFKSTDAGLTWNQLSSTGNASFHYTQKILVSPRNPQRIWAATRVGVFRSLDAGATFTIEPSVSASTGCTDMAMQVNNPTTGYLFVSCGRTSGQGTIWRAEDTDTSTFTSVLSLAGQGRSSIAVAPSNESVIYVLAAQRTSGVTGAGPGLGGLHGVYRSTANGDSGSFTTQRQGNSAFTGTADKINKLLLSNPVIGLLTECGIGTSSLLNQGWYDNVIAVDPLDADRVWVGGIDVWRSDNGGVDWGTASYWWFDKGVDPEYHHADQHALVFHPDYNGTSNRILYFGSDGGVSRTLDARAPVNTTLAQICGAPVAASTTFEDRSNGFVTTQFYDGVAYPDGSRYFGGLQDNGTQRGTSGDGNWSVLAGGDGGYVALDTLNDANPANDVLFLENTGKSLQRSTNGGASFAAVNSGITGSGFLFIAPFTMNLGNRNHIWTGGFDIWFSANQATAWTRMTGASGTCGLGSISALAAHPTDTNRVLIGMSDGCYHYNHAATTPLAGNWPGGATIASGMISWLAWDPNNINVAYATVSNFTTNVLLKTIDGGVTWSPSMGSGITALPQIPMLSVVVNPFDSQQVFVGSDLGVFTSIDGGATWYVENTGFAKTPVESLKFDASGNMLFAFTHGRGAWKTSVCNACVTHSIGGSVSGLAAGNSVTLVNNGVDDQILSNGAFVFPEALANGNAYAVSVKIQPTTPNQTCVVAEGSGTLSGTNVTNVAVTCTNNTYSIGGSLSGLAAGATVTLQNNGSDPLVLGADGSFDFPTPVSDEGDYAVTVGVQPAANFDQTCAVSGGQGQVSGGDVNSVMVACISNQIFKNGFE